MDVSPEKESTIPADGEDVGHAAPDGSAAATEAAVTASGPAVRVAAIGRQESGKAAEVCFSSRIASGF